MTSSSGGGRELFSRHPKNPILGPHDFPGRNAVFNPAATVLDGRTLLLVRTEHRNGMSSLAVATSENGIDHWEVDRMPGLDPLYESFEERWGVEDPRITKIGDEFHIVYVGYSPGGPLVCRATTTDFVSYERHGVLMPPEDKDAALFPATFGGRFALIHRPVPAIVGAGAHIWLSLSPDLRHWGDAELVVEARRGGWWDANKIGLGPPPLLTRDGWLLCYHGVRVTASGSIYRLGLVLLDLDDPSTVLARGNDWVLGPQEPFERVGDVSNVVFPCGWILRDDGDTLHLYYGAADSVVCVAEASLKELLDHVHEHSDPLQTPTP